MMFIIQNPVQSARRQEIAVSKRDDPAMLPGDSLAVPIIGAARLRAGCARLRLSAPFERPAGLR
jgi:hypothetical protein